MIDLQKHQNELANRKDAFWARKVVHLAGLKALIQVLNDDPSKEMLSNLVSKDILSDLDDHYNKKTLVETAREMIADVEAMLAVLLEDADKELQAEAEQTQH